ncbi:MAG TPA: DUF308 domain-containing protein [Pyrinomonadaceae bacterium]|nr:DUF308 domain-containing protein [Pyrinomonadaceae bacterium]
MKKIDWKSLTKRRSLGLIMMVLGGLVIFAPIIVGVWVIALLGVVLIAAGLVEIVQVARDTEKTEGFAHYTAGVLTIVLGLVLFLSPRVALSAIVLAITVGLLIDGGVKLYVAFKKSGSDRRWKLFNGVVSILLGIIVWVFITADLGMVAIGLVLGGWLLVEGWTMFFIPDKSFQSPGDESDLRIHPDEKLRLEPSDLVKEVRESVLESEKTEAAENLVFCLKVLLVFFLVHLLRTSADWSFIGFISPFSAVIGDAIMAIIIGVAVILPIRVFVRKLTRPLERTFWKRLDSLSQRSEEPTYAESALRYWLEHRMRLALKLKYARYSLNSAVWWIMRMGISLTAIFIAVNSIWGFSWYFNSENWASGVWQEITKARVDPWRKRGAEEVEADALRKGIPKEKIFAVETENESQTGDFSFIVIGDTGEGDPSQMVLRDQLIAAGKRENVKFLVLSSDVIYPDGKMKDYETNFYLPFKGFDKPIYAIPGNHDWFDANEGFNANFLEHDAAVLTLRARQAEDFKTDLITTDQRFESMTAAAARLRQLYSISNGHQRAPYFEIHRAGFSFIAADTGIMKSLDSKQRDWLEAALQRAGTNFKVVNLGHPFYVAGTDATEGHQEFKDIYDLLRRYRVEVAMAGDTHDFEFYKENYQADDGKHEMFHFVNGGGGAYLSVGTALAFPDKPVTNSYAFYPRTDQLTAKIHDEAPYWKMPFFWWMQTLGGYPFDSETVSGAFDFNRAPFFQSFLEVSVEPSQNRVRFLLYGVNGQLRWRDIQVGGNVKPADKSENDPVEFVMPMRRQ